MTNKPTSKFKRVYKRVSTIVVGLVMVVSIVALLSLLVQISGGKKPNILGYRLYYILTDSMTPDLQVNDVILSETINSNAEARARIKEGDIVTFIAEYGIQKGLTITHRVIKAPYVDEETGLEVIGTQGVKEGATLDPPVPLANIQAVMIRKVAFIGNIYRLVMTGFGLLLLIVVPLCVVLVILVIRLVVRTKKPYNANNKPSKEEIGQKAVEQFIERERIENEIKLKAIQEYKEKIEKNKK